MNRPPLQLGYLVEDSLASAEYELPRRFSPGLEAKKDLALAETLVACHSILAKASN
jgi:hypothetical protein